MFLSNFDSNRERIVPYNFLSIFHVCDFIINYFPHPLLTNKRFQHKFKDKLKVFVMGLMATIGVFRFWFVVCTSFWAPVHLSKHYPNCKKKTGKLLMTISRDLFVQNNVVIIIILSKD